MGTIPADVSGFSHRRKSKTNVISREVAWTKPRLELASGSPSASDNKVELTSLQHPWRGGTSGKRTCIRIEVRVDVCVLAEARIRSFSKQFALLEKVNMIAADVQEAALSSGKASNFMRAV
ncbi:hypothetical protein PC128_g24154 [Phytophthora cactorum]|nr:hypothetical protein PC128_g24154 [Phytophthora cactorum]